MRLDASETLRRSQAWSIALVAVSAAALAFGASPVGAEPPTTAFRFGYDDAGRLIEASIASGNTAFYNWDPVGNLTSIVQKPSTTVSVDKLAPSSGPAGRSVRIYGTDFSATASEDSVTFSGTAATVSFASPTELIATVPSGATSGKVNVVAPAGSASSTESFTVTASKAPTITAVSPKVAVAGSALSVTGTNFDTTASNDVLTINNVAVGIGSVNPTTIESTIPASTGSGQLALETPFGQAIGGDVFIPPPGYTAANVLQTARTTIGGTQSVSVSGGGKDAMVIFDGQAGERVFVEFNEVAGATGCCVFKAGLYDPHNKIVGETFFVKAGSAYLDTTTLPSTGTYTLVFEAREGIDSLSAKVREVPPDASSPVAPSESGTSQTVETKSIGQNAQLTVEGKAGQRILVYAPESGWHYGSGCCKTKISIQNPNGSNLTFPEFLASGGYLDSTTLPSDGAYTIFLDPTELTTGSAQLVVYSVPADVTGEITPTEAGATQTVETKAVGQNVRLSLPGTEGERVFIETPEVNYGSGCCELEARLEGPEGKLIELESMKSGSYLDAKTLPVNGTYTLLLNPKRLATGNAKVKVYRVPADTTGSIEIEGPSVSVSTAVPGQNASLSFSGTAGKHIKLTASSVTYSPSSTFVYIKKPDGSNLASKSIGTSGGSIEATLPLAGTYSILVDPQGRSTGGMMLKLKDPPAPARVKALARTALSRPAAGPEGPHGSGTAPKRRGAPGHRIARQRPSYSSAISPGWTPPAGTPGSPWSVAASRSPVTDLPMLTAPVEMTALTGRVLLLNREPLARVTMSIEGTGVQTRTDNAGRFLLEGLPAGQRVLVIDGATAHSSRHSYGRFEVNVDLRKGVTSGVGYTIWMRPLDTAHQLTIQSPTRVNTTLRTPEIPGLEVKISAGTVITDEAGKPVRKLTITAVPVNRPPFPLPLGAQIPLYFTVQPGGAYLSKPARIVYPNTTDLPPGQRVPFWNYDPDKRGWYTYGLGVVTPNGKRIVPGTGAAVSYFTGAMISSGPPPPLPRELCEFVGQILPVAAPCEGGDPVATSDGLFVMRKTDFVMPDVMPLRFTRTYRPGDSNSYAFGIGMTDNYDIRLWSNNNYQEADLILPEGARIHYKRTSEGNNIANAEYAATETPSRYYGSTLVYDGGWTITLRNGEKYHFGLEQAGLLWIRDRFGNQTTINRNGSNRITQLTSPNGRWIKFTYTGSCVTEAADSIGRSVKYEYDGSGRLAHVVDVAGGTTTYAYDSANRMTSIVDPRGITYVRNTYDATGRVEQQELGAGELYRFAYKVNSENGLVTQTTMTNPNGDVTQTAFNSAGYATSVTRALGTASAQTTSYELQPTTNWIKSVSDPLGRVTAYTYDSLGNVAAVTKLAGTEQARTTTMTYEPHYSVLASISDSLKHKTTVSYDGVGEATSVTDQLGHTWAIGYTGKDGLPTSVTDPLGHTRTVAYRLGEAVSSQDALGRVSTTFFDAGGRAMSSTDPLGDRELEGYNALNHLTSSVDSAGNETKLSFDADGNLTAYTDALGHKTTIGYDAMNRVSEETDALGKSSSYAYDGDGNLVSSTDRKGQRTVRGYDPLDRTTFIGYGASGVPPLWTYDSTVNNTYDAGDRLTETVDSAGGTFKDTWDGFDELTSESGPHGSVHYGYDEAGRRTSMSVTGQPEVGYSYDAASRLSAITGPHTVEFAYDSANRRTATTLPDGVSENYGYDAASELTGINFAREGSTVGELDYAYGADGRRTAEWGSYARLNLPEGFSAASYDADNELTERGTTTLSYDANGNLTAEGGTNTFSWNARNQLVALAGENITATFSYDAFGRREGKTVNGVSTSYLYDEQNVIQELSGSTPQVNYTSGLGLDRHYARTDSTGTQSFLTDAQRSTVALAAGSGAVQTSYTYDPFGAVAAAGTASQNPFQYTGRESDGTGLQFNRARYYSPSLARFISHDPLGLEGSGSNLYSYAANDPTDTADPLGLLSVGIKGGDYEGNVRCGPEGCEVEGRMCVEGCGGPPVQIEPGGPHHREPGVGVCLAPVVPIGIEVDTEGNVSPCNKPGANGWIPVRKL